MPIFQLVGSKKLLLPLAGCHSKGTGTSVLSTVIEVVPVLDAESVTVIWIWSLEAARA